MHFCRTSEISKWKFKMKRITFFTRVWFMAHGLITYVPVVATFSRRLIIWDLPSCTFTLKIFVTFFHFRISFYFIWNDCLVLNVEFSILYVQRTQHCIFNSIFEKLYSSCIGLKDEVSSLNGTLSVECRISNRKNCIYQKLEIFECDFFFHLKYLSFCKVQSALSTFHSFLYTTGALLFSLIFFLFFL